MSIKDFIANPLSYTKAHVVQFTHAAYQPAVAGMQVAATMNHWFGAWTAEEYQRIANQYTDFRFIEAGLHVSGDGTSANLRIGKGKSAFHTIQPMSSAVDRGIRFLPWKADTVTYMQLDAGARTFFTGPLSGCSIFIGRDFNGTHWAFHANRNSTGAPNPAIKDNMTTEVVRRLPAPVPILCQAIYQTDYHALGFVFGQMSSSGKWKFYVADTAMGPGGLGVYTATTTVREMH